MQQIDEWVVIDRDDRIPLIATAGPLGTFTTREAADAASALIPGSRVERVAAVIRSEDDQGRPLIRSGTPPQDVIDGTRETGR
jgi:hypothetical protein